MAVMKSDKAMKLKKLTNLINKYPNLPVISMVETEVVCDDCHSWWKAKIKSISRDFIYEKGESIYIQSIDDAYDVLTDYLDEMTDEEIEEKYNGLPWKEVIIVWVGC